MGSSFVAAARAGAGEPGGLHHPLQCSHQRPGNQAISSVRKPSKHSDRLKVHVPEEAVGSLQ